MMKVTRSVLLPYSASKMYDLVNDVLCYHEFLPWCGKCKVFEQDESHMIAEVTIAKAGFKQGFVTHNLLTTNQRVEINLVSGPFSHLHGIWTFKELDDNSCKVSLDLSFDYASKILAFSLGPIFNKAADTMLSAFCKRAQQLF